MTTCTPVPSVAASFPANQRFAHAASIVFRPSRETAVTPPNPRSVMTCPLTHSICLGQTIRDGPRSVSTKARFENRPSGGDRGLGNFSFAAKPHSMVAWSMARPRMDTNGVPLPDSCSFVRSVACRLVRSQADDRSAVIQVN